MRSPEHRRPVPSRRDFLQRSGMLAAAAALTPAVLAARGWSRPAVPSGDVVIDAFDGLVAFVVPGPDAHSVHQGASTPEPGGIDAFATPAVMFALDLVQLAPPPFNAFTELVAFVLNQIANAVHPNAPGPFLAPFSNLTLQEKQAVLAAMNADPALAPLGGALPIFVAFTAYSEAGVFDPVTRTLVGQPVGWAISGYDGVADGRDEFKGYFKNRKRVD